MTTATTLKRYFWAYAVKDNRVTLVAFDSRESALIERERLKHSDARTVGSVTTKKISEHELTEAFREAGRLVEHVRNETLTLHPTPAPRPRQPRPLTNNCTKQAALFDAGRNDLPGQRLMFPDIATQDEDSGQNPLTADDGQR